MRIVLGTVQPVIAVVVVDREDRVAPVGQSAVVVTLVAGDVGAGLHAQVVQQLVLDREITAVFAVGVLDVHAVVEVVVGAGLEHRAVVAALHLHGGVVRHGGGAEHQVVPARVGRPGRLQLRNRGIIDAVGIGRTDVGRRQSGVDAAFVREHRHQHRIAPEIQFGAEPRNGRLLAQRNARHVFLCLARGDENHAVGSTRTVDGRRRSIFEHLHRNDVLRVDLLQIAGVAPGESVDDHQRGIRTVERRVTADTHRRRSSGILRGVDHLHAGHAALQQSVDRVGGNVGEFLGLDRGHGARQVALLDLSVTHDHHFVHRRSLFHQHDIERGAAADLHRLRFITDEIDGQTGVRRHSGQRESPVGTGRGALRRTGYDDRRARHGGAVLIHDLARHGHTP